MSEQKPVIIAAIDLKPHRMEEVALQADALADGLNMDVRVIHVVDESEFVLPLTNDMGLGMVELETLEVLQQTAIDHARKEITERLPGADPALIEVFVDIPTEGLKRRAEELDAQIIVVGQPRHLFGSVSKHLARHAPCDLYIVRLEAEEKDG